MRQVKVVAQDLDSFSEPDNELTPIDEFAPCPVCGKSIPLDDFRSESIGEIWTGTAAEYAEEGVCVDCYRDIVAGEMKKWSNAEWLAHHYEGWRTSIEQIHDIYAHEESPHDVWLPAEDRPRILSVEKTIEQRKQHLERSYSAMLELLGKHSASITAPPFQMALATAQDSVSPRAIKALKARRESDLEAESTRRQDSVIAQAPVEFEDLTDVDVGGGTPIPVPGAHPSAQRGFGRGLFLGLAVIIAVTVIVFLLR